MILSRRERSSCAGRCIVGPPGGRPEVQRGDAFHSQRLWCPEPLRANGRIPRRYRVHASPRRETMETSRMKMARSRRSGAARNPQRSASCSQDRRDRRPQDFLSGGGQVRHAEAGAAAWLPGLVASVPQSDGRAVRRIPRRVAGLSGFGNSDIPDPKKFTYTFDKTAEITEKFLRKVGFTKFGLYVQDYGGPVGFRILDKHPDWLEWLIIQNTNAFEVGFTAAWEGLRGAYWKSRSPENEKAVAAFLEPDTIKTIYLHGHPDPEKISPDNWNMDSHFLERPNAKQVQLDFFYDYRTNVALYPKWQAYLKERQPKTIIFWGQTDIFFTKEGGEAFLEVLPKAEMHRLDSGHFAVGDPSTSSRPG